MDRHRSKKTHYKPSLYYETNYGPRDFYYQHPAINMLRYPRTTQSNRMSCGVEKDEDTREYHLLRGARRKLVTCYDDILPSRIENKSWKEYSKKRKQWED